jgi:Rrf2 family protein
MVGEGRPSTNFSEAVGRWGREQVDSDTSAYILYLATGVSMLSQKAKYAIRALLYLAGAESAQPIGIAEIAEAQSVPRKFLELILLEMKREGFVHSARGKKGGYALAREPQEIYLGDVVRKLDGPLAALPCASLTAYRRCRDCADEATCSIRRVFREVRDASAAILDRTSLAEMLTSPQRRRLEARRRRA